jgi:hypothetical protein
VLISKLKERKHQLKERKHQLKSLLQVTQVMMRPQQMQPQNKKPRSKLLNKSNSKK